VIVDVGLAAVLLVDVLVRDVDVLDLRMVVLVRVGGLQVRPVLSAMQVVRHVEVLFLVGRPGMVVSLGLDRHDGSSSSEARDDLTPMLFPACRADVRIGDPGRKT
jgi:hypothetical protein